MIRPLLISLMLGHVVWNRCSIRVRTFMREFLRAINPAIVVMFLTFQAAHANSDGVKYTSINDQLLWVGQDRFVVLRSTQLGFGEYFRHKSQYERVEISVFDGRVLARCSLGSLYTWGDPYFSGESYIHDETPPDRGCNALPNTGMTLAVPVLVHRREVVLDEGNLLVGPPYGSLGVLADKEFVFSRLEAMTAGERAASCESWETEGWRGFGGCDEFVRAFHNTGYPDDPQCTIAWREIGPWSNEEWVFIPISCPVGGSDNDSSLDTWLAVGRQWWDLRVQ